MIVIKTITDIREKSKSFILKSHGPISNKRKLLSLQNLFFVLLKIFINTDLEHIKLDISLRIKHTHTHINTQSHVYKLTFSNRPTSVLAAAQIRNLEQHLSNERKRKSQQILRIKIKF
jgi:hypothetical protein